MATTRPSHRDDVLERLVAGVVVIGVLLWGASVLATPDESTPRPAEDVPQQRDGPREPVEDLAPDPPPDDEGDGDEDDEDDAEAPTTREPGKRKKGRGG